MSEKAPANKRWKHRPENSTWGDYGHMQQETGAAANATNVVYRSANAITTFNMNIDKAYNEKAGLQSWNRNIEIDQQKNSIQLNDKYQFASANTQLSQTFMTVCTTDIDSPGKIIFTTEKNQKVQLTYDASDWTITKEKMALTEPHEQQLKSNWVNKTIWRVLLTNTSHKTAGSFIYTITKQ